MLSKKVGLPTVNEDRDSHELTYGSRYASEPVPKCEMPEKGMPANVAYQIIHDELNLDGSPTLNLASFVTTWMEPEADKLMAETLNKNYIDQYEYPQTTLIQNRCVNMLARLFHVPEERSAMGTATVGSSEALFLAGLALKWNWRKRRQAEGNPADRPNIVLSRAAHVCCEKFARYFDVEPRYVPLTSSRYVLGVEEALEMVDENTIAVIGTLGSTLTGEYDPIEQLNDALTDMNAKNGWDVPIHVDAASGGFVAPFLSPDLKWDFRLPLVKSINVSGHKYGLVYPGVGWVIWRNGLDLPEDLIFHVNYLGTDQPTFNLNFSRGANQILGQYYNFLRLGKEGYRRIMRALQANAIYLAEQLEAHGAFNVFSNVEHLPVVTFALKDPADLTVFDLSRTLRQRGWIVPAYTMPPNADALAVLRVVVREGLSRDMADMFLEDLFRAVDAHPRARPPRHEAGSAGEMYAVA